MNTNHQANGNRRNARQKDDRKNESGYALVGLMGVMMFALILTTVAAPSLRLEAQREKEEEMLWRGQQVARAISLHLNLRRAWPTDLKELIQVVEIGGKKLRLLRPSALCDPMTPCSGGMNWRLVHPGDPLPKELYDAVQDTLVKKQIQLNQSLEPLTTYAKMGSTQLPGQAADTQLDGKIGPPNSDSDSESELKNKQIIGVVSKKSDKMFRSYFGIEEYDHALFFPNVPVLVGGFVNPLGINPVVVDNPGVKNPICPGGGVVIDGKCWGGLILGPQKRDPNAPKLNP